jgi:hypothetical protein
MDSRKIDYPLELDELILKGQTKMTVLAKMYNLTECAIRTRKLKLKREKLGRETETLLEDRFIFDCF